MRNGLDCASRAKRSQCFEHDLLGVGGTTLRRPFQTAVRGGFEEISNQTTRRRDHIAEALRPLLHVTRGEATERFRRLARGHCAVPERASCRLQGGKMGERSGRCCAQMTQARRESWIEAVRHHGLPASSWHSFTSDPALS
jgi:hypothetical protein